jgi:hypothetical protein
MYIFGMSGQKSAKVIFLIFGIGVLLVLSGMQIFSNARGILSDSTGTSRVVSMTGTVQSVDVEGVTQANPGIVVATTDSGETFITLVPTLDTPECVAAASKIADVTRVQVGDTITVTGVPDQAGNIIPCDDAGHTFAVYQEGGDTAYGYTFVYRKDPQGYSMLADTESTHPDFLSGGVLFDRYEYELFTAARDAREGPRAMHVRVYANQANASASVWATNHHTETNSHLMIGDMSEVVVGGANGVRFTSDGLYPSTTYVIAHGGFMYVLSGSYMDMNDAMYHDFISVVESVTFTSVEQERQGAKIDPRVACESALMYMTFQNGEAAEAFVADCIAGKHPEVIDRYIQEMGGYNGAQI